MLREKTSQQMNKQQHTFVSVSVLISVGVTNRNLLHIWPKVCQCVMRVANDITVSLSVQILKEKYGERDTQPNVWLTLNLFDRQRTASVVAQVYITLADLHLLMANKHYPGLAGAEYFQCMRTFW
jgi:hypothetical protein